MFASHISPVGQPSAAQPDGGTGVGNGVGNGVGLTPGGDGVGNGVGNGVVVVVIGGEVVVVTPANAGYLHLNNDVHTLFAGQSFVVLQRTHRLS